MDNLYQRYTSAKMRDLWTTDKKHGIWKKLWLALAESQFELGMEKADHTSRITEEQLDELRAYVNSQSPYDALGCDYELRMLEKKFRHDVMAYVHFLGNRCPKAKEILHLGATSCFITDNTDLILMREGMGHIHDLLVATIARLTSFAKTYAGVPTLGYTHYQPAQFTTVGKRACLWIWDLLMDLDELKSRIDNLGMRGAKGATGTQDSFLKLFNGDHKKVRQMDDLIARKMDFLHVYPITGQTYSRKIDTQIAQMLSGIAQSAHKFATDLRLLQHDGEMNEPFETHQIGSSAMPYKRNPMKCERICGLSRFVMNLANNMDDNASQQWLERTLDDSVNRRLAIPQLFMGVEGILRLYLHVSMFMNVNETTIRKRVNQEFPFIALEGIMMELTKQGGDRQEIHERLRQLALRAKDDTNKGWDNHLLTWVGKEFPKLEWAASPDKYIGRAKEQTFEFLSEFVDPLLKAHEDVIDMKVEIEV